MHVSVPSIVFPSEGLTALRIVAFHADNLKEAISIELEAGRSATGALYRQFLSVVGENGGALDRSATTASTSATLRLRWDHATATFHAEYDADGPANGDAWQTLRT